MAVVFKRLPAVTFCSMLIRPQSMADQRCTEKTRMSLSTFLRLPLYPCLILALPYLVAATGLPLDSVGFKINISLHTLLITTNLNLYNSLLPFPTNPTPTNSQPFFLSFSCLLHFPQEINVPKITLTHCR